MVDIYYIYYLELSTYMYNIHIQICIEYACTYVITWSHIIIITPLSYG